MGPLILQSITMLFILIQDLKMQSRLALKACLSSCLSLPITGTTGTRHHTSQSFKQYSKLVATFSLIKHAITRTDWQMMKGIQKRNQPRQQQPRLPPAPVHWRVCTAYPFCVLDGQLKSLTGWSALLFWGQAPDLSLLTCWLLLQGSHLPLQLSLEPSFSTSGNWPASSEGLLTDKKVLLP